MGTLTYSHTLTAGTAENINDVQDMFNDVKTLVNGNITGANAPALLAPWRTVAQGACYLTNQGANDYLFTETDHLQAAVSVTVDTRPAVIIPWDPADYAVTGATTKMRLLSHIAVGSVAPGTTVVAKVNTGTVAAGSTTGVGWTIGANQLSASFGTPSAATGARVASSEISAPTSGTLIFVATLGGAIGSTVHLHIQSYLQVRHV